MALTNLGDIYDYCNVDLLDEELDSITDIVEYLEEAQNIIAELSKIEAPLVATVLDSTCQITLPSDLIQVKEFALIDTDTVNEQPIEPLREWANVATFNTSLEGRTVNLYYYRKPTALTPNTLTQVPDIDSRYFYSIAQYAAEMYKLKDDDTEAQNKFREKFVSGLTLYRKNNSAIKNFKNVW